MKFAVFEISSEYAHFKTPESTRGNFSFPFPPRTAIMGIIAGILGIERNSYWLVDNPLYDSMIALEVINPVEKDSLKVNYSHTRTITSFSKIGAPISILMPKDPGSPESRGFTTQFKLDVLRNASFRIYIHIMDEVIFKDFIQRLEKKKYVYPPYLGHANFLANIDYLGTYDGRILPKGKHKIDGIVPASSLEDEKDILVSSGGLAIVFNVPMVMKATLKEKPSISLPNTYSCTLARMDNIILQTESDDKKFTLNLKEQTAFELILSGNKKRLVIFPYQSLLE